MKRKMAVAVMAMAVSAMASSAFAAQEDTTYQKLTPAVKAVKAELVPAKLVTIQNDGEVAGVNGTQAVKAIKATPISMADKAVMMEAVKTTPATPKK